MEHHLPHEIAQLLPSTQKCPTTLNQASNQFTYTRGIEGQVGLDGWLYIEISSIASSHVQSKCLLYRAI